MHDAPRAGDVVSLAGPAAQVPRARVIRNTGFARSEGWVWLEVYVLDTDGQATEKREAYIKLSGITLIRRAGDDRRRTLQRNNKEG